MRVCGGGSLFVQTLGLGPLLPFSVSFCCLAKLFHACCPCKNVHLLVDLPFCSDIASWSLIVGYSIRRTMMQKRPELENTSRVWDLKFLGWSYSAERF